MWASLCRRTRRPRTAHRCRRLSSCRGACSVARAGRSQVLRAVSMGSTAIDVESRAQSTSRTRNVLACNFSMMPIMNVVNVEI
jgi:hypothetical protein